VNIEFFENITEMILDRLLGDEQPFGNLSIR